MRNRHLFVVFLAVIAVGAISFAPSASAQDNVCSYNNTSACRIDGPTGGTTTERMELGDLSAAFADDGGPTAETVPATTPVPASTDDTVADVESPQLAFTGSESDVLAYVGSGMVAFGALALAARRRLIGR